MDSSSEAMVARVLCDKKDPSLLTWKEIEKSFGSCVNFMLSYNLRPYNSEDIKEALNISRALKKNKNN